MRFKASFAWLILLTQSACHKSDSVQTASQGLSGNWVGTNTTQQISTCSWDGPASVPITASWQVTGTSITGTLYEQPGIGVLSTPVVGTIDGNKVRLRDTVANNVICSGIARSYFSRYEGTLQGNTLSLVSIDTLCVEYGCIFKRTLSLTRQP